MFITDTRNLLILCIQRLILFKIQKFKFLRYSILQVVILVRNVVQKNLRVPIQECTT